jgi:ankyrin repeat protein
LDVLFLVKERGADVNRAAGNGVSPLFTAAHKGHEAVVVCLVKECGADINQTCDTGRTPLMIAAHIMMKILKMLLQLGADSQASTPCRILHGG